MCIYLSYRIKKSFILNTFSSQCVLPGQQQRSTPGWMREAGTVIWSNKQLQFELASCHGPVISTLTPPFRIREKGGKTKFNKCSLRHLEFNEERAPHQTNSFTVLISAAIVWKSLLVTIASSKEIILLRYPAALYWFEVETVLNQDQFTAFFQFISSTTQYSSTL